MYLHFHINKKRYLLLTGIFLLLVLLSFGYVYIAPVLSDTYPVIFWECVFKNFFHLYCPGCGGTHALYALLHLHPLESFLYHPLVIYIVFFCCFFYIKIGVALKRHHGETDVQIPVILFYIAFILVIAFFILRNVLLVRFGLDYPGELKAFWGFQ